jgi:hypothetical protein
VFIYLFFHFQVQTEFTQVSETQFVFNIPEADGINHIVVFMTGQQPFPDTMGGAGKNQGSRPFN